MVHGISKALVLFDQNLKSSLKSEKLTTRDSELLKERNREEGKLEEAFSFLKDNFLLFNCYNIKCAS